MLMISWQRALDWYIVTSSCGSECSLSVWIKASVKYHEYILNLENIIIMP